VIEAGDRKLKVSVISPTAVGFVGEGEVVVRDGSEEHRIGVAGGFLQVVENEVSVLAERVITDDSEESEEASN
jgi:F0F1-type ATP synthase epsilon subunit